MADRLVPDTQAHAAAMLALSPAAKLCWYTLTTALLGGSGIAIAHAGTVAALTGHELPAVEAALRELEAAGFLAREGAVVWMRAGLASQGLNPNNPNHRTSVARHLESLAVLAPALVAAFREHYAAWLSPAATPDAPTEKAPKRARPEACTGPLAGSSAAREYTDMHSHANPHHGPAGTALATAGSHPDTGPGTRPDEQQGTHADTHPDGIRMVSEEVSGSKEEGRKGGREKSTSKSLKGAAAGDAGGGSGGRRKRDPGEPAPWMALIRPVHRERYDCDPPDEVVKALRPLVAEHGPEEVADRYRRMIGAQHGQFFDPFKLGKTWGDWAADAASAAAAGAKPADEAERLFGLLEEHDLLALPADKTAYWRRVDQAAKPGKAAEFRRLVERVRPWELLAKGERRFVVGELRKRMASANGAVAAAGVA
jgi:hypothetical protein